MVTLVVCSQNQTVAQQPHTLLIAFDFIIQNNFYIYAGKIGVRQTDIIAMLQKQYTQRTGSLKE